jgi:predicted DsbA family dithiol-disulfide isomerase
VLEKFPNEVKLVIKNFPLSSHPFARKAALAALAAANQGKFWEMHRKLLEQYRELNDAKIEAIAQEVGLNMEQYNRDLKDESLKVRLEKDVASALQAEVRGTPTLFLNGKLFTQRSLEGFQHTIEGELKKKKAGN